jgi:RNAse (barnase) inhibitor barstar
MESLIYRFCSIKKSSVMWVFDQSPNCATFTSTHVMRHGKTITHAFHDESDHSWSFLSEEGARTEDAMIVSLEKVVKRDPSVLEIADLPPGWMAQRDSVGAPWRRKLQYADAPLIAVDWSKVSDPESFYDLVFKQCGAPSWHGRNLDALADSWVTGDINDHGPPYAFAFTSLEATPQELASFRDAVLKIARESIEENGGRFVHPLGKM